MKIASLRFYALWVRNDSAFLGIAEVPQSNEETRFSLGATC
jgi:hypothetical protein